MLPYIPTYYVLQALSLEDWSRSSEARLRLEQLSTDMALCFRDYLFMACLGEARHSFSKLGHGFAGFKEEERDTIYKQSHQFAPSPENLARVKTLFEETGWGSKGYGGEKWANLADLAARYGTLSDTLYVDAVVNAQHNGGTAFSKGEAEYHMDISFKIGLGVLKSFLDFRRSTPDFIGGFTNYFQGIALTPGKLLLAYASETRHVINDIEQLYPLPDKTYEPVAWGTLPLPAMIDRYARRCRHCGAEGQDDYYVCSQCEKMFCAGCFDVDADKCNGCLEDIDWDEHDDEDKEEEEEEGRCPVCLMKRDLGPTMTTFCGLVIHMECYDTHRKQCISCPPLKTPQPKELCSVCHKPLYWGEEHWHLHPGSHQESISIYAHKYCYCLDPVYSGNGKSDFLISKKLLDEIAEVCGLCHTPVLKDSSDFIQDDLACAGYKGKGYYHSDCWQMHRAVCQAHYHCDCEECTTSYSKWKELYEQGQEQ